jgi:hypothetical protein
MALSGFARLVLDLRETVREQALAQERAREAAAEARNLWRDCADNSLFLKAIGQMSAEISDMSRSLAAKAKELRLQRRAEGRQRLAALIAEADAAIAAGLITGEQGAKLDAAIARAAEGLRGE